MNTIAFLSTSNEWKLIFSNFEELKLLSASFKVHSHTYLFIATFEFFPLEILDEDLLMFGRIESGRISKCNIGVDLNSS